MGLHSRSACQLNPPIRGNLHSIARRRPLSLAAKANRTKLPTTIGPGLSPVPGRSSLLPMTPGFLSRALRRWRRPARQPAIHGRLRGRIRRFVHRHNRPPSGPTFVGKPLSLHGGGDGLARLGRPSRSIGVWPRRTGLACCGPRHGDPRERIVYEIAGPPLSWSLPLPEIWHGEGAWPVRRFPDALHGVFRVAPAMLPCSKARCDP